MAGKSVFEKVWDSHVIATEDDRSLLFIDRHLVHEVTSPVAFSGLSARRLAVRRRELTVATVDHNIPTASRDKPVTDQSSREQIAALESNVAEHGILYFGYTDPLQGIVHVIAPELGITLPGTTVVCGDSHTPTNGALGALAFGIGTSEIEHVLATQSLWLKKPGNMLVSVKGNLRPGCCSKDVVLYFIRSVGVGGAIGHVVEYTGPVVDSLSVEERMTLTNMSVEAGGRSGIVSPDAKTIAYVEGRLYAPRGEDWNEALDEWKGLRSDTDAQYNSVVELDGSDIEPQVTWGTDPSMTAGVSERIPDPEHVPAIMHRESVRRALSYMGLEPGTRIDEIAVDTVFIGSCTNARLGDLIAAAEVLRGKTVHSSVKAYVMPGSQSVKREAERIGLDRIFLDAGFEWRNSGCSLCLGMNEDRLPPKTRCASTSNRNFQNRQGMGVRTHLVSPATAAATAVAGRFAHPQGV